MIFSSILPLSFIAMTPMGRQRTRVMGSMRLRADDQHVQRVAVVAVGAGDEAVVGRVVRRRVKDAVEYDKPGFLVELVLLLAALGYLDDCDEFLGLYALGV